MISACVAACTTHAPQPQPIPVSGAREELYQAAHRCSSSKLIQYSKLSESAETVARAAYDTCGQAWNVYVEEGCRTSPSPCDKTVLRAVSEREWGDSAVPFVIELRARELGKHAKGPGKTGAGRGARGVDRRGQSR